jgi:hypothetical protein
MRSPQEHSAHTPVAATLTPEPKTFSTPPPTSKTKPLSRLEHMKAKQIKSANKDFGIDEKKFGVKTTNKPQVSKKKASTRQRTVDAEATTSAEYGRGIPC